MTQTITFYYYSTSDVHNIIVIHKQILYAVSEKRLIHLSIILDILNFLTKFCNVFIKVAAKFIHILLSVTHSFVNSTTQSANFWS